VTNNCNATKVIARTWTATDACGNSTNCVQTITVRDITKPVVTCPPDRTLECPADTSTNANGVATATDTCSAVVVTYSDSVSNSCGGTETIARTWTATDACGNSSSCVQTITVRDTTKPALTCPPDLVLECPADTSTNATGVATAQDTCQPGDDTLHRLGYKRLRRDQSRRPHLDRHGCLRQQRQLRPGDHGTRYDKALTCLPHQRRVGMSG